MSQSNRIAKRMIRRWTSTLEMMRPDSGPQITSPHRRLTEWRREHEEVIYQCNGYPYYGYLFNGKLYEEQTREIKCNGVRHIERRLRIVK